MNDVMGKVRALLALTTSSNIDEARNAALAMAKLIRLHNILLVEGPPGIGTTFPAPSPPVKPPRPRPPSRAAEKERTAANKASDDSTSTRMNEVHARQQESKKKSAAKAEAENWTKTEAAKWHPMKAKFPGLCKECKTAIVPNAYIVWHKKQGASHLACFHKAQKANKADGSALDNA